VTASRVQQAGALAVDLRGASPLFLIVAAKRTQGHWVFPKGHLKRKKPESLEHAALRELKEEAGVRGDIIERLGSLEFDSAGEQVTVDYFLVAVRELTDPEEDRARQWLDYPAARQQLSHDDARTLLDKAVDVLRARALWR
jgi:ADP-ribose pyrophosphatase YjhB (NUDIX family)